MSVRMDIITMIRDPYERFISNFNFKLDNQCQDSMTPYEWSHLNFRRDEMGNKVPVVDDGDGPSSSSSFSLYNNNSCYEEQLDYNLRRRSRPIAQFGKVVKNVNAFRLNFNKPNYYTAFLNGFASNDDGINDNDDGIIDNDDEKDNDSDKDKDKDKNNKKNNEYSFDYFAFGM